MSSNKPEQQIELSKWQPSFADNSPIFTQLTGLQPLWSNTQDWPTLAELNGWCQQAAVTPCNMQKKAIQFVPQAAKSTHFSEQYEPRIYLHGQVQTRERNWHDFFNALMWLAWPRLKANMNALQYKHLQQRDATANRQRTAQENALTLFDENGIIITSSNPKLLELIQQFAWQELFVTYRETLCNELRLHIIGHSLFEKALTPYIGMTGTGLLQLVSPEFHQLSTIQQRQQLDKLIADELSQRLQSTKQLNPFPVLGMPGWHPDNADPAFYENRQYFREKRSR